MKRGEKASTHIDTIVVDTSKQASLHFTHRTGENMYPPVASPTSPQDVPMTDLNILNVNAQDLMPPQKLIVASSPTEELRHHHRSNSHHSLTKASNTLRNNIDLKNEMNKKRTSLNLDNGHVVSPTMPASLSLDNGNDTIKTAERPAKQKLATVRRCSRKLDNANYRIECNNNNHNGEPSGSTSSNTDTDTDTKHNGNVLSDADNRKVRRVKRKNADKARASEVLDNDDDDGDYNDTRNGSTSDSTEKRDSVTSKESSDDYFLCEKFKNTLNAKLCDAVVNSHEANGGDDVLELMSPQEAPLGRRYAEITPVKINKW